MPFVFESVYARSFAFQLYMSLSRVARSYQRNVNYNFTRIVVLWGLMIMFGVIYYKMYTGDEGGVLSMVSVIFITTLFIAIVNMNTALPARAPAPFTHLKRPQTDAWARAKPQTRKPTSPLFPLPLPSSPLAPYYLMHRLFTALRPHRACSMPALLPLDAAASRREWEAHLSLPQRPFFWFATAGASRGRRLSRMAPPQRARG